MAKRKTRRSISLAGTTYERTKRFCERGDLSVSGYVEGLIAADLDRRGEPIVSKADVRGYGKRDTAPIVNPLPGDAASGIFTF